MSGVNMLRAIVILVVSVAWCPRFSPAVAAVTSDAAGWLAGVAYPWPLASHFVVPPIVVSADGRYLALGGSVGPARDHCPQPVCQGRFHVWDLQTGQRIFVNESPFARVTSIVFSRNAQRVMTGHSDGTVLVWNVNDFTVVARFSCCAATWIRTLALSPREDILAIGAQGGQLILWNIADDIRNGSHVSRALRGHDFGISSLAFDASGEHLLSAADDQHIRRWTIRTGGDSEFHRSAGHQKAHRGMVKTVVMLNGGKQALSGAYWEGGAIKDYQSVTPPDHILRLWDVETGEARRSYPLTYGIRCCLQVLSDNRVAFLKATGWHETPILQIFNLDTGQAEREYHPTMGESFHTLAMHPNGRIFFIGLGDGHHLLWDSQTGRPVGQLLSVDEGWAVMAADGRIDFSDGFRRWPCRHNVQQACLGGAAVAPTRGVLARLIGKP